MGTWEDLENPYHELNSYIAELRKKLWRENKIKFHGYTYSEWKEVTKWENT